MEKKKILICGATGFIGRNLIEHFAANSAYEVFGTYYQSTPYNYSNVKMLSVNLTDPEQVKKIVNGVDILIQAAAVTSGVNDIATRPVIHITDNVVMNSLLLRAAYENNVKHFVFFSCTVMYQSSEQSLKETDYDANADLYPCYFGAGWTKVYLEKMCEFYSKMNRTKFTVLRHSNIYGPYDKYDLLRSHVFGATVTKVMTSENGKVNVWGDGSEKRDLLYVSDLINAVELAIDRQNENYGLYNIGYGSAISVKDLVNKIARHAKREIQIVFDTSKPTIKTSLCLNCDKAKRSLGWGPKISIDEGIQKSVAWYREHQWN